MLDAKATTFSEDLLVVFLSLLKLFPQTCTFIMVLRFKLKSGETQPLLLGGHRLDVLALDQALRNLFHLFLQTLNLRLQTFDFLILSLSL
jgi:hypothetical protein